MNQTQKPTEASSTTRNNENEQAEKLVKELETFAGAQRLGDEAYEIAKQDQAKRGQKP